MSGDLSLSQSLGGLRIANPDDESTSSPAASPPPPPESQARPPPPPSSHSSNSTVTDSRPPGLLPALSHPTSENESVLGFNPDNYSLRAGNVSPAPSRESRSPSAQQTQESQARARLSHRKSMPLDWQAQQAMQYPSHLSSYGQQMRQPSAQSTSIRPISGMYSQHNTSSSSGISQGSYGYRGDTGSSDGGAAGLARSGSRGSRQALNMAPSRESSRNYRQSGTPMNGAGNGPLPPRRNSRRTRAPGSNGGYEQSPEAPYSGNAQVPRSAEEWRDRGASQSSQQETDPSGQPVQRTIKKGVKDFNFGRTLGEGSYSTVLAATDRQNLKEYAIKVLDKRHIIKEKKVKYVNIERDTLNRLTEHPGVVRLYYTFQDERSLYFVLDLASGGELLGVLKKMGSFDMDCTRFYSAQILDTIAYMHTRGVIHRDLKPENVLLDRDMHVKITDFGTAKILKMEGRSNGSHVSGTGAGDPTDGAETDRAMSFVGTAEYVSPELLRDKNACKASDLWAFGCIVYQLIAGRPPFKAANEYLTFQKILGLEYTFPDGFPEVARDLVERLLVLEPANRLPVEHIMNHQFFDGVQWGTGLWKQKAPRLKAYVPAAAQPIKLNGSNGNGLPYGQISSGPPTQQLPHPQPQQSQAPITPRPQLRGITELPPPSQLDIEWSSVLTHNNERILKLGNLVVNTSPQAANTGDASTPSEKPKFSRFFGGNTTKKRERLVLITSSARLLLAAAGGNEKKAKTDLSLQAGGCTWKSYVDAKGLTGWCIDTRDKHYTFEDPRATSLDPQGSKYTTQEWLEAIDSALQFAASYSQTTTSSYPDSLSNGLDSSIESPADSLGGDAAMPMSGPSSAVGGSGRHTLRKERDGGGGGDGESVKGRKRFSKRHSKSGIAAVF